MIMSAEKIFSPPPATSGQAAVTSGRGPGRAAIRAIRQRVSDDKRSRPVGLKSLLRGVLLLACLAPTTALTLTVGGWLSWIAHWVVASAVLATIPSVYHEGTHHSLSRIRTLNDGIATVAAALQFVPFATWRYFHLAHHANTGTDADPEDYPIRWSKWSLITFPLFQYIFIYILWKWTVGSYFHRGPRWVKTDRQVRAVRRNTAATLAVIAVIVASSVLYWRTIGLLVVPSAGGILISSITIVPEHFPAYRMGPGEFDQLDRTGTYTSNVVTRFIMWNSNFHAAHHFAPKVPAHYLPRLDSMLSEVQSPEWRWGGYIAWYAAQLRRLPWWPPTEPAKTPAETTAIVRSRS
jgi:fatty acid desaturase